MVYIVVGGCVDGVHCGGRLCEWCTLWWEVVWMVYIVVGGCVNGVHCGGRFNTRMRVHEMVATTPTLSILYLEIKVLDNFYKANQGLNVYRWVAVTAAATAAAAADQATGQEFS